MDKSQFAAFKYSHGHRAPLAGARKAWFLAALAAALAGAVLAFPGGLALFLLPLVVYFGGSGKLLVGPRYLLCGQAIVYYGNVVKVALDRNGGTLTLVSANQERFVLEREKFPTGARKTYKVAANKTAKFRKACDKIIDRVKRAAPDAELAGLPRGE